MESANVCEHVAVVISLDERPRDVCDVGLHFAGIFEEIAELNEQLRRRRTRVSWSRPDRWNSPVGFVGRPIVRSTVPTRPRNVTSAFQNPETEGSMSPRIV